MTMIVVTVVSTMIEFVMTPDIKWLEANYQKNKAFDSMCPNPMFELLTLHECELKNPSGFCYWTEDYGDDDEEEINYFEEWVNSKDPDFMFEAALKTAEESPFYKAIAR
jgi:hypothetical protein